MDPLAGIPLLQDLPELDGKRVLVRVDFNVPLHIGVRGQATVADDFRIGNREGTPGTIVSMRFSLCPEGGCV